MSCINKFNNEAVALVMNNRHPRAIQKFHEALVQMRGVMRAFPKDLSAPSYVASRPKTAPRHHVVILPSQADHQSKREDMFLYLNPILLDEPTNLHPSTLALYCAVTLFNVAILYHIEGVAKGRMRFLDKAQQMYQASLHFLNGQGLWNDTVFLLSLAAHNNLAHIELEKGTVEASNGHLGHAFELLQSIKERALDILSDSELHGFLLNSSLQGRISSAAAA
ncbi:unnamed protein product [Cylindrotheca closterium]|uniref:Uncharacterized protein n=1 Tax=Cylindrotheca closterium TaxID=2856 RepID=A0AAD2CNT1_9STRA|nr:unnamed protein product [Cylindrotheca closterium]